MTTELHGRKKRFVLAHLCYDKGYTEVQLPDGDLQFWWKKANELGCEIPENCQRDPSSYRAKLNRIKMRKYRMKKKEKRDQKSDDSESEDEEKDEKK